MDIDKQPGIKVDGIILAESFFKRTPNVVLPISLNIGLKVSNNINSEKKQLITEMRVTLNSESDPVFGHFLFIGIFSYSNDENMTLQEFAKNNAAAYIFPYIREEIQNRSVKAGLPPIIIQPLNFVALTKCSQQQP